ncbi:MAG: spore protease YyaC [Lachnospiraceae bacterium]|nr:spore protease YyaC [Lachnospiraceae bacterium]
MFDSHFAFWHTVNPKERCFSTGSHFSAANFGRQLLSYLPDPAMPILFLCIGSDRLTGDSLGPLIGHRLSLCTLPDCIVFGTLAKPVHAENLACTLDQIRQEYPSHLVIAIDAALDKESTIGQIFLHNYPLFPGAGVQKSLPCAGQISITGVVAPLSSCSMTQLSEIHLSLVVQMADCIVEGVLLFLLMRLAKEHLTGF